MEIIKNGFKNERLGIKLDVYIINGKEWFKAQDISEYLGYIEVKDMVRSIEITEVNSYRHIMPTAQGNQYVALFLDESALYEITFSIRKTNLARYTKAREFQQWVFSEVLPSIRKNNFYIDNKNFTNEDFEKLEEENRILRDKLGNYTNITLNNNRRCQSLETYLRQMFPNQKDVFEQFIDGFKRNGYLDENGKPTEIFEKKNKPHKIFKHITEVCDGDSNKHTIVLTNKGINLFANDLYIEDGVLKCKNREGSTRII